MCVVNECMSHNIKEMGESKLCGLKGRKVFSIKQLGLRQETSIPRDSLCWFFFTGMTTEITDKTQITRLGTQNSSYRQHFSNFQSASRIIAYTYYNLKSSLLTSLESKDICLIQFNGLGVNIYTR